MATLPADLEGRKLGGFPDTATIVDERGQPFLDADRRAPVVLPRPVVVTSTPTVDTSALATGDLVAQRLVVIEGASKGENRTTVLQQINVLDKAVQSAALEVWFFDVPSITMPTVNAAWAISDAHAERCLGWVSIPAANYAATSNNSVAVVKQLGQSLVSKDAKGRIWYAVVSRGAPTYAAATDLTFSFTFYPDA